MNKNEIRCMFNKISADYDFLNNLISFFTHIFVKKHAIKCLNIQNGSKILDVCTGSGDLASIIKEKHPDCTIIGVDFSDNMLNLAKKKHPGIEFIKMDACELQFCNDTFDYVVIGFGLRNIPDKQASILETKRVLKNGGQFLHLDFGEKNFLSKILDIAIIVLAKIFSRNFDAYKYLVKSKKSFFTPSELINYVSQFGFKCILRKDFFFKVVSCQVFKKY